MPLVLGALLARAPARAQAPSPTPLPGMMAPEPSPTPPPASAATPAATPPPLAEVPVPTPPYPNDSSLVWHVHSPFSTLERTRRLLDTIGIEILAEYQGLEAPRRGSVADRPGTLVGRSYVRTLAGGERREVDVAVTAHPAGGFEIYVEGPGNPDLPDVESRIEKLVGNVAPAAAQAEGAPLDRRRLAYEMYQLSYVEPDRALALLKALDYTTIEFNDTPGETVYDKIFAPNVSDKDHVRLPVVIKMVSASKTSLQENTAEAASYAMRGNDLLPDLGGILLHRTTAGEPQNRLLIAYDPDDPEAMERLVNLLREKVDVPARELMLEALVIEIQSDALRDLGVDFEASGTKTNGAYTNTFGGTTNQGGTLDSAPGTFLFNRVSDVFAFKVALSALLQRDKAKVLSNPSVLVLDGRQAKIQIGQRIPVVETTVTTNTATESILYFPVGIVLNLRPRLSSDGSEVSMQVETIVSSVRTTTTSGSTTSKAPEVDSRQVQTFVRVQNDTPFIVGGLTSNEETSSQSGVPLLSRIPFLGALFRHETVDRSRKEIIIVVTPHLVPEDTRAFSYVIPQESAQFDSFGRELLYNAYRIRQQDVFSLGFLHRSDAFRGLAACARRFHEAHAAPRRTDPDLEAVLDGVVPGEDVLVRRMLWEIVRKTDYARFVDLKNFILFEKAPEGTGEGGFRVAFLSDKLAARHGDRNALVLSYRARVEGTPEHPFGQPTADVSYERVTPQNFFARLAQGNRRSESGIPDTWTILLTDEYAGTARPIDVLKGVMVLRRILALNPEMPQTLAGFRAGRQIVFPTENELRQGHHLVDAEAARLFYEITSYYPAFEEEFKAKARRLVAEMGGCPGLTVAPPAETATSAESATPPAR